LQAKFRNLKTGEEVSASYWIIFRWLFDIETPFAFVTILCAVMSVMLTLFFLYHLIMALSNATTNERSKRSDIVFFLQTKIEYLEYWSIEKMKKAKPKEIEILGIDINWNKS
jgi:hypothetical protein